MIEKERERVSERKNRLFEKKESEIEGMRGRQTGREREYDTERERERERERI